MDYVQSSMAISDMIDSAIEYYIQNPLQISGFLNERIVNSKRGLNGEEEIIKLQPIDKDSIFDSVMLGKKGITKLGVGVLFDVDSNTDAYAWYQPFHYFPNDWGIRIRGDGALHIANRLRESLPKSYTNEIVKNFSFQILYWHEFYHFVNEVVMTSMEIVRGYEEKFYHNQQGRRNNDYRQILSGVRNYTDELSSNYNLEEALANSLSLRYNRSIEDIVSNIFDTQPAGYRHFRSVKFRKKFFEGSSILGVSATKDYRRGSRTGFSSVPISPYELLYKSTLKDVSVKDVPLQIVNNVPNIYKFKLFKIPSNSQFEKTQRFSNDMKKLSKKNPDIKNKFDREIMPVLESGNMLEINHLQPKPIMGKEGIREMRHKGKNFDCRFFIQQKSERSYSLTGIEKKKTAAGRMGRL
tara:strand:+ start:186 stop:1415 length:1230 start_codon:yes stop_codon:yes gene_type:complete